jgi:hypothetical protein
MTESTTVAGKCSGYCHRVADNHIVDVNKKVYDTPAGIDLEYTLKGIMLRITTVKYGQRVILYTLR